jgi:hypothetical protein
MRSYDLSIYCNTNSFIVQSSPRANFFCLSAADPRGGADRPLHMPPHSRLSRKVLAYTSAGTLAVAGGGYYFLNSGPAYPTSTRESRRPQPPWLPPGREKNIDVLKASGSGDDHAKLDLLIVGGGATGAGVAVDAASRGLKVALVERDDFSSGIVAPTVHSNLTNCEASPQGHRRNRQSSSMAAFVTYRRRSWSSIMSSTS